MIVRPVEPGDKAGLRAFECSDGARYATKVQTWIRRKSFGWGMHGSVHHRLQLLVGGDEIVGLYAYEPGELMTPLGVELLEPQEPPWFIMAVAVRLPYQRSNGIASGIGESLLNTCLDELSELDPAGRAYWKVDDANEPSHRMSLAVGAEPEPKPAFAKQTVYFINL